MQRLAHVRAGSSSGARRASACQRIRLAVNYLRADAQQPVSMRTSQKRTRDSMAGSDTTHLGLVGPPEPDREQRLGRLLEVGRSLVTEFELDVVLERVLEAALDLTGARYAAIGVLDE